MTGSNIVWVKNEKAQMSLRIVPADMVYMELLFRTIWVLSLPTKSVHTFLYICLFANFTSVTFEIIIKLNYKHIHTCLSYK